MGSLHDRCGHMVQNYIYWWASCAAGLPKQRQVHCFGSTTVCKLAHQHVWFCTMWSGRANGLFIVPNNVCVKKKKKKILRNGDKDPIFESHGSRLSAIRNVRLCFTTFPNLTSGAAERATVSSIWSIPWGLYRRYPLTQQGFHQGA